MAEWKSGLEPFLVAARSVNCETGDATDELDQPAVSLYIEKSEPQSISPWSWTTDVFQDWKGGSG